MDKNPSKKVSYEAQKGCLRLNAYFLEEEEEIDGDKDEDKDDSKLGEG